MIGLIFIGDIKYCPYIKKYINIIKEIGLDYEVIFWNREGKNIKYPQNYIFYNKASRLDRHHLLKLVDFIGYKKWLRKLIKQKKYKKLILLSTLSGILLFDEVIKNYKGNYIFDIRDYSYEHYRIFRKIESSLIKSSYFTSISSEGFKAFLPKNYNYIISHNFDYSDLQYRKRFVKKNKGDKLNIVFIGSLRYFNHQKKIIDRLKNDKRFQMLYHGSGPDYKKFLNYCNLNKITNVNITGEYDNRNKSILLQDADIINNSYGSRKINAIKYAISNKYYDGLIYGIPQLVELNTYKHKKVESLGIGFGLDVNDHDFADKLYDLYFKIDEKKFGDSCNNELQRIQKEDQYYIHKIREFILS